MTDTITFTGTLETARGGGHVVEVDPTLAASIDAKHRSRVRGTVNEAPYRSNLVSMGGRLVLGVHKAVALAAGASPDDEVRVTMSLDVEPLPTDTVPPELEAALASSQEGSAAWDRMPPSHRRRYVGYILEAKKPETRQRRAESSLDRVIGWGRSKG